MLHIILYTKSPLPMVLCSFSSWLCSGFSSQTCDVLLYNVAVLQVSSADSLGEFVNGLLYHVAILVSGLSRTCCLATALRSCSSWRLTGSSLWLPFLFVA